MEHGTSVAEVEIAHLALDATWVEAPATADAAAARDLVEHRLAPGSQTLRGERPQLAAACA